MRTEKWGMYINMLQGHPSVCSSGHTVESMKFITTHIPPQQFPRMLDIGVGEGLETKVLKDLGYDATGLINGQINLDFALQHYPGVKYIAAEMHDLPFPMNSFDAIYTNHAFEHAFAPFILLLEMNCILRDFGRVWIAMPEFKEISLDDSILSNPSSQLDNPSRISYHHPNMLCYNLFRQIFECTGFKVIYNRKIDGNPYYDNPYLLEKQPLSSLHSTVQSALAKRKEMFG